MELVIKNLVRLSLLICLVIYSPCSFTQDDISTSTTETDTNHILIFGKRKRSRSIGQSTNLQSYQLRGEDLSSKSMAEIYRQQASIAVPVQDFSDPLRLLMPKLRLQDTKLNEVYLNDLVLVDPQSSLQDMRGFDLKSFGAMDIFYGQSPAEFHSQSPSGLIHFFSTEDFGKVHSLHSSYGFSLGQEYSLRYAWNRNLQHIPLQKSYVFVRRFLSKGDYEFYDSNQTPYETSDDKRSKRRNNSSASGQVLSLLSYQWKDSEFTWLAATIDHRQDLGSDLLGLESSSSKNTLQRMHRVSYSQNLRANEDLWWLIPKISISTMWNEQKNTTKDSSKSFLVNAEHLQANYLQKMAELKADWKSKEFYFLASYRKSLFQGIKTYDHSGANTEVRRDLQKSGISFSWVPWKVWQLDGKYILAQKKSDSRSHKVDRAPYVSSSLSCEIFGGFRPYIQWSQSQRFPSVLEENGDGGYFQASENLQNEKYFHREIGSNFSVSKFDTIFSAAYFVDEVEEKILWLPSSFGSFKAQNISKTEIQGADLSVLYSTRHVDISFSQAWANAIDFGELDSESKALAFSPEWIRVGSLTWKPIRSIKVGSDIRYQSAYFIDRQEQVKLGEHWSQNLYLDSRYSFNPKKTSSELKISMKVINLWNQDSQKISAFGQNTGKVSVSEFPGYPSPSRSFNLQFEYLF